MNLLQLENNNTATMTGMKKHSVAIIEDNLLIKKNLNTFLGFSEDMEVTHNAGSVESYLQYIQNHKTYQPDLMLLDIGLPGMTGLEGIPLILKEQPNVNIIMLTTFEEETKILKAMCSGAVAYLSKKASLEEIIDGMRVVAKGGSYMSPMIAREIFNHMLRGKVVAKPTILTDRQMEILERFVEGKTYTDIAAELFISVETVRHHVKKMYKTLHVNSKSEAIALYLKGDIK